MYERFTDRARKVMRLAHQEAIRRNLPYLGTEHILLGLVKEGMGIAANVLKNLGVELRTIRTVLDDLAMTAPETKAAEGNVPMTPCARQSIDAAMEEAAKLRHRYVGTEHLLLGLLAAKESTAGAVLTSLDVGLDEARAETLSLLEPADEPSPPAVEVETPEPAKAAPATIAVVYSVGSAIEADLYLRAEDAKAAAMRYVRDPYYQEKLQPTDRAILKALLATDESLALEYYNQHAASHDQWLVMELEVEGAAEPNGVDLIAAERQRQIEAKGFSAEHDDRHTKGELAIAAACYAVLGTDAYCQLEGKDAWPWDRKSDKRHQHNQLQRLIIAGALLASEIDRELRQRERKAATPTKLVK